MDNSFLVLLGFGIFLAIVATGEGFMCYDDSCTGSRNGRPCKTASRDFNSDEKKYTCRSGCKYSTIKDSDGRPIPNQPFIIRDCWDVYYDRNEQKEGTCTEVHDDNGQVRRVCVCTEDWCNAPEQDGMWDAMSSSPRLGQVNSFWVMSTLALVGFVYSKFRVG